MDRISWKPAHVHIFGTWEFNWNTWVHACSFEDQSFLTDAETLLFLRVRGGASNLPVLMVLGFVGKSYGGSSYFSLESYKEASS